DFDPEAFPTVKTNAPGLTGVNGGTTETCSLASYAGQSIHLAFRLITDWATQGNDGAGFDPGWWVDDIQINGSTIPNGDCTSCASWQSTTQGHPVPVNGFTVQLISYTPGGGTVWIHQLSLDSNFDGSLSGSGLSAIGSGTVVAALVMYNEPTELIPDYAP